MTLDTIERAAKIFSEARDKLRRHIEALRRDLSEVKRRKLPRIRETRAEALAAREELLGLVRHHPELFERPKTRVLHGIRIGWKKRPGRLEIEDEATTVRLIRKHLPDQAATLIKVKETPVRPALAQLSASDLKRIGVRVSADTDAPLCQTTDDELDRIVDALMAEADEEQEAA